LAWLERVDVAGLEPWGRALGFGWRVAYSHAERLSSAGLAQRVYDRRGSVVAITRAGRRLLAAPPGDLRVGATYGFGISHARAVSWAAALMTLRGHNWLGERALRRDERWRIPVIWPHSQGSHRPDLVAHIRGADVAVEIELAPKGPRRLHAIMAGYEHAIYQRRIGRVLYLCASHEIRAGVRRAAGEAALNAPDQLAAILFGEVPVAVRRESGGRPWPGTPREAAA
jgi:hypothetical protein